jgi:HD-GYP domain-containing protein (c-di-GMP phosphodiesterase class II)
MTQRKIEIELENAKKYIEVLEKEKRETTEKLISESSKAQELLSVIIPLGTALSSEKDLNILLNKILLGAQGICAADAGTIYTKEGNHLIFKIIRNESLKIQWNDKQVAGESFPAIDIYDDETGECNNNNVASLAAYEGRTINIQDAYQNTEFDFSGTKRFDEQNDYKSKSFLTVPLKNHNNDVIGILQLINAKDPVNGNIIEFSKEKEIFVESLSSLAATAIDNQMLLQGQKDLLDSFIKLISHAIDQKSPYTGGHCNRVPYITEHIANAACKMTEGPFANFNLSKDDMYELKMAAWLHDIGKITTPEYVVDKATKLETIHDRISNVKLKITHLIKDAKLENPNESEEKIKEYLEILEFLEKVNIGGEFLSNDDKAKIDKLAKLQWVNHNNEKENLLTEDEVLNLSISRGTLNDEERKIINNHIVVTIKMLEKLPLPKGLKRVVEFAGGHHEKMDGTGYPNGLTREQMSIQARMMAIADIFEALTASDRPYKKGKKLSEAIHIMSFMKKENHIDPDLYDLFIKERVFDDYAKDFLKSEQLDEINIKDFL